VYLLDRDIVSLYLRDRDTFPQLRSRIIATPNEQLWISIIGVEEAFHGGLALVHRNRLTRRAVASYAFLEQIFRDLQRFNIAAYDDAAEDAFTAWEGGRAVAGGSP